MKIKKHVWLPSILAGYFIAMLLFFGFELLKTGQHLRFWGTVGAEALIIFFLVIFLKKREKIDDDNR